MKIDEVKKNLNKIVRYKDTAGLYRLTACILRKNEKGLFYQAELLDTRSGNSVIICKLDEVQESEGKE